METGSSVMLNSSQKLHFWCLERPPERGRFHIGPYETCPDLGLYFQLKFLNRAEEFVRNS